MHRFLHIAQDNFYRNLTSEEQSNIGAFNFDHPAVSCSLLLCLPLQRTATFPSGHPDGVGSIASLSMAPCGIKLHT